MKNNCHEIHLRIDDTEYQLLQNEKMFMKNMSISKIIRMMIRFGLCFYIDFSADFEVATQISKIGTNINQITRVINETHCITPEQAEEIINAMQEVNDKMELVLRNRGRLTKYEGLDSSGNILPVPDIPPEDLQYGNN